jgi:CRP-like cAMP-binding protein
MKNLISRTIRQSIITYLSKQSKLQDSYKITITMSKKSLAEMFGVSRTSLSRELQQMAAENLITFDAKTIQILNIDILE